MSPFLLLTNQIWFALHILNFRALSRVPGVSIIYPDCSGEFKSGKKIPAQRQGRSSDLKDVDWRKCQVELILQMLLMSMDSEKVLEQGWAAWAITLSEWPFLQRWTTGVIFMEMTEKDDSLHFNLHYLGRNVPTQKRDKSFHYFFGQIFLFVFDPAYLQIR